MAFFKRARILNLRKGDVKRYLLYAIGEIILIVIGIMIALNFDDGQERQKQKLKEIAILEGIRRDILRDTIDINVNIRGYQRLIKSDSILAKAIAERKPYNKNISNNIFALYFSDYFLILHESSFQLAKEKGLDIISNPELREEISRLYEFNYKGLLSMENNFEVQNYRNFLNKVLIENIHIDYEFLMDSIASNSVQPFITQESYNELIENTKYHVMLMIENNWNRNLLESHYRPTLKLALEVAGKIEEELKILKEGL